MIVGDLLQDQNPWWRDGAIRRARGYPIRRELQPKILARISRLDDRRAVLLLGPRQVGKTVLLLQTADDLLDAGWPPQNLTYFDFSDDRLPKEGVSAREVVEVEPIGLDPEHPRAFLLDEIHLAPGWDRWLKQAVDHRVGKIVATDSAASLLRVGSRESGQGRWDEIFLESLNLRELAALRGEPGETREELFRRIPNLTQLYLSIGGFPEHALSIDLPEVRRRLRSDIAERAVFRDLTGRGVDVQRVKDLLVYLIQDSGAELKVEARAGDLRADARSVRDWIGLLLDTLLVVSLDRFARHAAASLRSRPRIYAIDPGLIMAFALAPPQDPRLEAQGVEAAVYRHLREVAREQEWELSYFRQDDDLEIDFVLDRAGDLTGIEVTSSSRVRPDKVRRVQKAGAALGAKRLILVYNGALEETVGGVRAVTLSELLLNPLSILGEGS